MRLVSSAASGDGFTRRAARRLPRQTDAQPYLDATIRRANRVFRKHSGIAGLRTCCLAERALAIYSHGAGGPAVRDRALVDDCAAVADGRRTARRAGWISRDRGHVCVESRDRSVEEVHVLLGRRR